MGSRAESPEEIKRLSAEHSALARQQYEALQKSPYFQMWIVRQMPTTNAGIASASFASGSQNSDQKDIK
jgi:hypothetical protein